jgi:hypothetical protein
MASAIVILQRDPVRAERLAAAMKSVSSSVKTVTSVAELHKFATRSTIGIAVLDLDVVTLPEIAHLRQQLGMEIVGTHHAPDDAMWSAALGAGATDCCFVGDAPGICRAIQKRMAA